MHKTPYVHPIVGQRKVEHLQANIEALRITLTQEDLDEIDGAAEFDVGFPNNFIFMKGWSLANNESDVFLTQITTHVDAPPQQQATKHRDD